MPANIKTAKERRHKLRALKHKAIADAHDHPKIKKHVALLADNRERLLRIHAKNSPVPKIALSVAENVLLFKELKEYIGAIPAVTSEDLQYQDSAGEPEFNQAVVTFLNDTWGITPRLGPSQLTTYCSTRCALEILTQSVYEKIEKKDALLGRTPAKRAVLIPTPFWQGFAWVFEERVGAEIIDVDLVSDNNFELTVAHLERAWQAAEHKPQTMLLTQPNNPLGINYSAQLLEDIIQWAVARDVYVLSDEIYGHCEVEPSADTPRSAVPFTPILKTMGAAQNPQYVHSVWGVAKDLGLSGFRVGMLLSRDPAIQQTADSTKYAYFSPMTSSNNWLCKLLFEKEAFGKYFMHLLHDRITVQHKIVKETLDKCKIPYFEGGSYSAVFFWLDLRQWLNSDFPDVDHEAEGNEYLAIGCHDDESNEEKLDNYISTEAHVTLLRGETLSAHEEGFFRMCYTAKDAETMVKAIRQISEALYKLKPAKGH